MRVLMTGGGTGGHVNPAIAIANTIKRNIPDAEIAFVGTKHGKEVDLVPRAGYKLYFVEIQGIRRSLSLQNLKTAYYVLTAPNKAKKLIKEFKPDIVIGTGGYACWPTLKAASQLGISTMVHESNALPGLAVRKLQRKVDKILINFDETRNKLNTDDRKIIRVGNPLRGGFENIESQTAKKKLNIDKYKNVVISVGGSLGAQRLNEGALELMKKMAENPDTLYMHAAGVRYYEEMKDILRKEGLDRVENIILCDYIHDMPLWMAAADVVISRAGAMTLSELALMNKASILIPSPNVTDNHQYKNAKVLADAGAALLIEEKEMVDEHFSEVVLETLNDKNKMNSLRHNISKFADADVNYRIFEEIKKLVLNNKS